MKKSGGFCARICYRRSGSKDLGFEDFGFEDEWGVM